MEIDCPSNTALRVARRRAAHQLLDEPRIFDDPLALRILGLDAATVHDPSQQWLGQTPISRVLRASLAARSRFAEDELHAAVRQGIDQYVVLGAGLDTFACRSPYPAEVLRIFEVDHPVTQQWKRTCLTDAGLPIPPALTFTPVDFETQTLGDELQRVGFDAGRPAFFSWLGVTMYLTRAAIDATLGYVAGMPAGSRIVFDYMIDPALLSAEARMALDTLARHVARAGEPFQTSFHPATLASDLRRMGFSQVEDLGPEELDARYFRGRTDGLRAGRLSRIMYAGR